MFVNLSPLFLSSTYFISELTVSGSLEAYLGADGGVTISGSDKVIFWQDHRGQGQGHDMETDPDIEYYPPPTRVRHIPAVKGHNVIRFNQYEKLIFASSYTVTTGVTIFAVYEPAGISEMEMFSVVEAPHVSLMVPDTTRGVMLTYRYDTASPKWNDLGTLTPLTDYTIISAVFAEGDQRLRLNGALDDSATLTDLYAPGVNDWEGTMAWGDLAELVMFDRVLNEVEIYNVEHYLEEKYGVELVPTLPISGNLALQLDAQAGITLSGTSSYVIGWEDQSDDGNDVAPWYGDVAHSPTWVDNVVNGYPVVRYPFRPYPDEPGCGLEWDGSFLQATETTLFYVFRVGGPQTYEEGGGPNNLVQGGIWLWVDFDGTTYLILSIDWDDGEDWGSVELFSNEELSSSEFYIITVVVAEGDQRLRINGVLNDSATQTDLYYYFDWLDISCYGDVAEVIIYERILSASETDTVEDYLSRKYNIPLVG